MHFTAHPFPQQRDEFVDAAPLPIGVDDEADAKAFAVGAATVPTDHRLQRQPRKQGAGPLQPQMQACANRWQLVHEQETAAAADIVGLTDDVTAIDFNLGFDVDREATGIAFNVMDVAALDKGQQLHACGVFTGEKGQAQTGRCASSPAGPLPLDLGANAKPHFFGEKVDIEFDLITGGDVGFARDKEPARLLLEGLLSERGAIAQRQEQQWA